MTSLNSTNNILRLSLLLAILLSCTWLRAVNILGNLPSNDGWQHGIGAQGIPEGQAAFSFTMPVQDYTLDSLVLRLEVALPQIAPVISLRADDAGGMIPGSLLVMFTNPTLTDTRDNYTFTPATPFTLQHGVTYWVLVDHLDNGEGYIWRGSAPSLTPTGVATAGLSIHRPRDMDPYFPANFGSFQLHGTIDNSVPTLGQWGIMVLTLLSVIVGVTALQKNRQLR